MAGPWDKYQNQSNSDGPWDKYSQKNVVANYVNSLGNPNEKPEGFNEPYPTGEEIENDPRTSGLVKGLKGMAMVGGGEALLPEAAGLLGESAGSIARGAGTGMRTVGEAIEKSPIKIIPKASLLGKGLKWVGGRLESVGAPAANTAEEAPSVLSHLGEEIGEAPASSYRVSEESPFLRDSNLGEEIPETPQGLLRARDPTEDHTLIKKDVAGDKPKDWFLRGQKYRGTK